jgi:3-hydroxyisobutyrate dehydrogenase-like beta-hydroxyacid dehydrogenase
LYLIYLAQSLSFCGDTIDAHMSVLLHVRRFLEAPVSGSKGPAATGTLIFLCAGSEDLFNEIKDSGLKAMGKASHFFSTEVGYGTRAKLVVNSLMGTMLAAFGEGLALSESVGLDPNKMVEVIGQGAIASPMYNLKGPKMVVKDHAPNFPLKHAHKVKFVHTYLDVYHMYFILQLVFCER